VRQNPRKIGETSGKRKAYRKTRGSDRGGNEHSDMRKAKERKWPWGNERPCWGRSFVGGENGQERGGSLTRSCEARAVGGGVQAWANMELGRLIQGDCLKSQ